MTPDRWHQISQIYHAALARSDDDRATFLAEACQGDELLRREVQSLLAQPASAQAFLEGGALAGFAQSVSEVGNSVLTGRRLGPYHVQARLGAGGMGDVYRARDTKLGRDVAIKILPRAFTNDPERLKRFEREARMLAALNHPNIGAIYGLEDADGMRALVLELVDGETLADRIARGPLPLKDALAVARQIVDALDTAHERGIVHRDLKPSNVALTRDGTVKVIDFGLAKATTDGSTPDLTNSPTMTGDRTRDGIILGTAAYMSPEQARGQGVDKRTDIWAFGCVLYEMLCGREGFTGDTASDVIAQILGSDPDFSALPAEVPASVRRLLERCLAKDRRDRLRDIGDARLDLEADAAGSSGVALPRGHSRSTRSLAWPAPVAAALATVALAGVAAWWLTRGGPSPPSVVRTAMALPASQPLVPSPWRDVALSPDGTRFAYTSAQGIVVRARDRLDGVLLPRSTTFGGQHPFFSSDGAWIAYSRDGGLYKVPVTGGTPVTIAKTGAAVTASWAPEGILFADANGLFRVTDEGTVERIPMTPLGDSEQGAFPEWLPGGRAVLLTVIQYRTGAIALDGMADASSSRIEAVDPRTGRRTVLLRGGGGARYVSSGYLAYSAAGKLYAVAFDLDGLRVRGEPVEISAAPGSGDFAVSADGTLLHMAGVAHGARTLVWVDRSGREEALPAPPRAYGYPRISPTGDAIAVVTTMAAGDRDVLLYDIARRSLQAVTVDPSDNATVAWSRDGRHLAFASARDGFINPYWQPIDRSRGVERLLTSERAHMPLLFLPDGRLAMAVQVEGRGGDIAALTLDGSGRLETLVGGPANQGNVDLDRSGRWLAYHSNESGQFEVYVTPFGDRRRAWLVSTDGGRDPWWSHDGRELFYRDFTGAIMSAEIAAGDTFHAAPPRKLIDGKGYLGSVGGHTYDVASDGRFLMIKEGDATPPSLILVLNWTQELKRLVPSRQGE